MIIGIPEIGGIGNHQTRIAVNPERVVIRSRDILEAIKGRYPFTGDGGILPERAQTFGEKTAGAVITNKEKKITTVWQEAQSVDGVLLRMLLLRIITYSLHRNHARDILSSCATLSGINI